MPADVIELDDYRPHEVFRAVCFNCCKEVTVVMLVGLTPVQLECPECGHHTLGIVEGMEWPYEL